MNDETRNVLRKAKGIIAENWGQGCKVFAPANGECLLTAIQKAAGSWNGGMDARQIVRDAVSPWSAVHDWNDAPGRTQAEVVALLDSILADNAEEVPKRTEMVEGVLA
jgi:hypothetical protein